MDYVCLRRTCDNAASGRHGLPPLALSSSVGGNFASITHWHLVLAGHGLWLVQADMPLKLVSEALGYASVRATEVYAHVNPAAVRASVEKIGASHSGHTKTSVPLVSKGEGRQPIEIH